MKKLVENENSKDDKNKIERTLKRSKKKLKAII